MSSTLEFRVQIDPHASEHADAHGVDPQELSRAIARAIEYAMDDDIEGAGALNRAELGQISVTPVGEVADDPHGGADAAGPQTDNHFLQTLRDELRDMGFGNDDQDINGGDFVEYGGTLFEDLEKHLAQPAAAEPAKVDHAAALALACRALCDSLHNWMEIADEEDKREYDEEAMAQGRAALAAYYTDVAARPIGEAKAPI